MFLASSVYKFLFYFLFLWAPYIVSPNGHPFIWPIKSSGQFVRVERGGGKGDDSLRRPCSQAQRIVLMWAIASSFRTLGRVILYLIVPVLCNISALHLLCLLNYFAQRLYHCSKPSNYLPLSIARAPFAQFLCLSFSVPKRTIFSCQLEKKAVLEKHSVSSFGSVASSSLIEELIWFKCNCNKITKWKHTQGHSDRTDSPDSWWSALETVRVVRHRAWNWHSERSLAHSSPFDGQSQSAVRHRSFNSACVHLQT